MLRGRIFQINLLQKRLSSTFLYPDMSQSETEFVQAQVALILQPKCLNLSPEEILVPKSRKFLVSIVDQVQKEFRDFKIPKIDNEKYIRNLSSRPKVERVISALKWAKIDRRDLNAKPDLLLKDPCEIFEMAKFAEKLELTLPEVEEHRAKKDLHGLFVINHVKSTILSMKVMSFSKCFRTIPKIDFAKHSALKFGKLESLLSTEIVQEMSRQIPELQDLDRSFTEETTSLNLARIFYLWRLLKRPKFDLRTLKTLDSTEAIIQLNAMCKGLGCNFQDVDKDIVWNYLHKTSLRFPLGLIIEYLNKIGFDEAEIQTLLLQHKTQRLSSKSLPMTSTKYVPYMKERLENLRNIHPDLSSVEYMSRLVQDDKSKNLKNLPKEIENV